MMQLDVDVEDFKPEPSQNKSLAETLLIITQAKTGIHISVLTVTD